jgi:hypothetical protein
MRPATGSKVQRRWRRAPSGAVKTKLFTPKKGEVAKEAGGGLAAYQAGCAAQSGWLATAAATASALTRPVAGSGVRTRVPSTKLCRLLEPKTGALSRTNSWTSLPGASIENDRPRPPGALSDAAGLPPVRAKRATTGRRTPARSVAAVDRRAPAPVLTHSPTAQTPLAPERRRPGRAPPPLASMPLTSSSAVGDWAGVEAGALWARAPPVSSRVPRARQGARWFGMNVVSRCGMCVISSMQSGQGAGQVVTGCATNLPTVRIRSNLA